MNAHTREVIDYVASVSMFTKNQLLNKQNQSHDGLAESEITKENLKKY